MTRLSISSCLLKGLHQQGIGPGLGARLLSESNDYTYIKHHLLGYTSLVIIFDLATYKNHIIFLSIQNQVYTQLQQA